MHWTLHVSNLLNNFKVGYSKTEMGSAFQMNRIFRFRSVVLNMPCAINRPNILAKPYWGRCRSSTLYQQCYEKVRTQQGGLDEKRCPGNLRIEATCIYIINPYVIWQSMALKCLSLMLLKSCHGLQISPTGIQPKSAALCQISNQSWTGHNEHLIM